MTVVPTLRDEATRIGRLAVPIALAFLGVTLLGLVEVAVLGRTSPAELGGAAIGRSVAYVALALGIGVSSALEPLAAQAVGAGDEGAAWRSYVAALAASVVVATPCAVLAFAATWLLGPLGVQADLVTTARAFVAGHAPSLVPMTLFLTGKTYLQAHGRTSAILVASIAANLVNVVTCTALVLGVPALGLAPHGAFGAGLASTVAGLVLAAWVLSAARALRPAAARARPRSADVARVLRIGAPIGLQYLAEIGVFSLIAVLAGRLGDVAASAHQIAIGLASFTFMGVLGISSATSVRVGVAVGEGRAPRRPGLVGIAIGAGFMACCGAVFVVMPRRLVTLFTSDVGVVTLGAKLLLVAAAFQLFDGIQGVAAGALRGVGDVRFPFAATLVAHWLVGLPLALLLGFGRGWGAPGLWWGLLVGLAGVATLLSGRFVAIARRPVTRL